MERYYIEQAGSGIPYFEGRRYQKGYGFFGRLIKGGAVPLIKYFGKKLFDGGLNMGKELYNGESIKGAARKTLRSTIGDMTDDLFDKVTQRGSGRKRRRRVAKKYKRPTAKRLKSARKVKRKTKSKRRRVKKLDFL